MTSMPCSRASCTSASVRGVATKLVLFRCTMCTGAPVIALAAINSMYDSTELPGSAIPVERLCTNTGAWYFAAERNISSTSYFEAAGVYSSPIPTPRTTFTCEGLPSSSTHRYT